MVGGGGIVCRCANKSQPSIEYALKVPRPSLFKGAPQWVKKNYDGTLQEIVKHAPLSHENVVRVVNWGQLPIQEKPETPSQLNVDVILMEWIEGAQPLNRYLAESDIDYRGIVNVLTDCFQALSYIHGRSLIHWDIKSDNLLVAKNGRVKLTDIGNARRKDDPNRGALVYSTRGNPPEPELPKKRGRRSTVSETSRRIEYQLPNLDWDCPWLDMWMLAHELNRLLLADPAILIKDAKQLPQSEQQKLQARSNKFIGKFPAYDDNATFALEFLRLLVQRLLHPRTPHRAKCYDTAAAVIRDLGKLIPEFGDAQSVPELLAIPQRVLRLPQSGNAPWTGRIGRVFNSGPIQRLRKHKQLGAVSQVFPGATHSRLEHVAGTMSMATEYVRALYADRTNPFWRMQINSQDIDALILAGLLHDVGHIAFGHYLEEMEGLFSGRTHVDYAILVLDPDNADGVRFTAPSRTAAMRDRKLIRNAILEKWGVSEVNCDAFLRCVREVLEPACKGVAPLTTSIDDSRLDPELSRRIKVDIIHSIMDSAYDADKLDYLLRDAHHCGVHYAHSIDVDRFFQSLTSVALIPTGNGVSSSIAVTEKGVLPVESMLIARYQMFSCVYWQHTNRALIAMLQFLVLTYIAGVNKSESEMDARLDQLIVQFRELDDDRAVQWLQRELLKDKSFSKAKRRIVSNMANAILGEDRRLLYWAAFELPYTPRLDSFKGTIAKEVYDRLTLLSEGIAKPKNSASYIRYCQRIRNDFCEELSKALYAATKKNMRFEDGEVLIDVPPGGKDQVDNVLVVEEDEIKPIHEVSPLASAVKDAFQHWVRKPRVFLSPQAWNTCRNLNLDDEQIKEACINALKGLVLSQLELPLKARRATSDS